MNLEQAYNLFILSREEYCTPKTVWNYKNNLKYFMEFISEHKKSSINMIDVNDIDKTDLQAYTLYLRDKPKYKNHPFNIEQKNGITKRSIKTYQTDVRTFFNYLFDDDIINEQITRKYKIIKPEKRQLIPLSEDDIISIEKLYNPKTELGLRNLCLIHLMLDAGLRHNEVLNLKLSDVNFNQNYILVVDGKGSKDRIIPLAPRLKKLLYTYVIRFRPYCDHNYVLCNTTDKGQLTKDCVKSLFARMKKHTDLNRLYPHLLRHTFATAYIMQGGDLESLRIYMGHSDIATTQKYLHIANQFIFHNDIYKLDKKFFRKMN
jgi:site-specific recombinase XerD|nr:tyrosine-type recombinase/integrase [uncultured Lachnoclostridium sp.]